MKQRLPAKRTTGWTSNLLAAAGDVLVPLLFAFGVGSIFSLICGCNPFTLYSYIIKKAFFSVGGLLNTLGYTTPIIITGMATALSIRANMYNMGIEGQVFLGAFTAALAGYMIKGVPTALHVTLCLLIGAAFGAVYALIPGLLKAKLRVNEVVTTVMLNSIATQVTGFLTQSYLGTGDAYAHTEFIEQTARLAKLNSKYRCTTAIFIALAIWLILYFILKKTKFGYEIDCIGKQWEFADAVGMHVSRKIVVIFVVGGALAGIAGATEILGVNYNFVNTFSANPGIGWDGFFVCILAGSNPVGTFEYNRGVLFSLDFLLFDEPLFLRSDAFQQNAGRLVIQVLRHELALNSHLENGVFQLLRSHSSPSSVMSMPRISVIWARMRSMSAFKLARFSWYC